MLIGSGKISLKKNKIGPCIALLVLQWTPSLLLAHAGDGIYRYVAQDGQDSGDCSNIVRPCKTIAYAAAKVIKGDTVLVAAGKYEISDAADLFRLVNAQSPMRGGYNRFDMYLSQNTRKNPTVLYGIPRQYAAQLEGQGFVIKSDIKFLFDSDYRKKIANMGSMVKKLNQRRANIPCVAGMADIHACENVDLLGHIPLSEFSSLPASANDIWGFQDLNDGREYILIGLRNGIAVVDVSDPLNPVEIDTVTGGDSYWRDIKVLQTFNRDTGVWDAYAYVTADGSPDGVKVIDLTSLPTSVTELSPISVDQYAHNVYISNLEYSTGVPLNNRNPLMHITGSSASHGIRGYDVSDPASPVLSAISPAGQRESEDYIHDSSSFISAPNSCSENNQGCEVFIDFNEDNVRLWNVEDRSNPTLFSSFIPSTPMYIHSGWPTEDGRYLFIHDELDEYYDVISNTEVEVFDISDLSAPVSAGTWIGPSNVIDHNGYVRGNRYYISHYESGLVILDISDPVNPVRAGYFDTFPAAETNAFSGAWGVYPFLPSGVIAVADVNSGLYLLKNNTLLADASTPNPGNVQFNETDITTVRGEVTTLTVARNDGNMGAVSVQYETIFASADSGDIALASGTLEWMDGDAQSKLIEIPTVAGLQEHIDLFLVRLFNPQGGVTLGNKNLAKTVLTNNLRGLVNFASNAITVDEDNTTITISVTRSFGAEGELSIQYQTVDNTAVAGEDYTEVSGTISWSDQDASEKTIEISLLDDELEEGEESFSVELVGDDLLLGALTSFNVTISANDTSSNEYLPSSTTSTNNSGGGSSLSLWLLMLLSLCYAFGTRKP